MICKGPACTLLCMPPGLLVETCWWTSRFPRNPWQDGGHCQIQGAKPLQGLGRSAAIKLRALGHCKGQGHGAIANLNALGHYQVQSTCHCKGPGLGQCNAGTGPQCNAWGSGESNGGSKQKTEAVRKKGWGVRKKDWGGQKKGVGG